MTPTMPMPAGAMPDEEIVPEGRGLEAGYTIELSILPDGIFKVSGPEPLVVEAARDEGVPPRSEMGEDFTSVGEALKQILSVIKDNPVGDTDEAQFEAGYGAR